MGYLERRGGRLGKGNIGSCGNDGGVDLLFLETLNERMYVDIVEGGVLL